MSSAPRLCPVIQGVEFTLELPYGQFRALATRDLLEQVFGAGESPDSWFKVYAANALAIDQVAIELNRRRPPGERGTVVISERLWRNLVLVQAPDAV